MSSVVAPGPARLAASPLSTRSRSSNHVARRGGSLPATCQGASPAAASKAAPVLTTRRTLAASLAIGGAAAVLPAPAHAEGEYGNRGSDAGQFHLGRGALITASGLEYQDLRVGEGGDERKLGDKVVVDWDGYTIHLSHVIAAKQLAKGGAFEGDDRDFLRFSIGDGTMIGAFDEALVGMKAGGVRRILVRPGPLYYPVGKDGKGTMDVLGPKPATFSGRRSLDFVIKNNGNIDRTLLFDLELLDVSPTGQARRGPGQIVARAT